MMLAAGIDAVGCEINTAEYEVLVERGLPVTLADAREFLSAFKPESLAAVTAVQVVEHLQADYLVELLTSIGSELAPGGVVVLETPNMLNWLVHQNFWLDISHVRPYPPATLQFYLREAGLRGFELWRSSPRARLPVELPASLRATMGMSR